MARTAFALVLVAAGLLVAGCTTPAPGPGNDNASTTPPTTSTGGSQSSYTPAQALALLGEASRDFPPEFGFDMKLTNNSTEVMTMKGLFDNTTKTSYVDMRMDPSALGAEAEQADEMGMGALFANGFVIYGTPQASVWIVNGTVFAMPPDEKGGGAGGMFGGQDPTEAFSEFSDPHKLFSNLSNADDANNGTVIKSITPTIHKGKPAVSIVSSITEDNRTFDVTIVLYTNPTRPAHVEGQMPAEGGDDSPFSTGFIAMDFYYGDEVTTKVPDSAKRALGLAYESDAKPFSGSRSQNATWTFLVSGGVPASDVALEVKDSEGGSAGMASGRSLGDMATLWSMRLSEGTKTQDGVTLAFVDHDHDDKVSAGDQVTMSWTSEGAAPTIVLHDTVSGYYVMPGPALGLTLALAFALAFALRRRP